MVVFKIEVKDCIPVNLKHQTPVAGNGNTPVPVPVSCQRMQAPTGCSKRRLSPFLLETCIDQARFMGELLATDALHQRIEAYVRLRAAGTLKLRLRPFWWLPS